MARAVAASAVPGQTPQQVAEERPVGSPPEAVVLRFVVPNELAGLRLDRFVQHRMPRLTRTRAQKIVQSCAFRLNGARRRPSDIVQSGEIIYLVRERFEEPETPLTFDVLHQDEAVLLVDKPAGLPMHPTATYHKHTLSYLLRTQYEAAGLFVPRIAHRLDRETSGIVVCARHLEAERRLKKAFERHEIDKSYLAIVVGQLPELAGDIDLPLAPVTEGLHVLMEIRPDGLKAFTHYEVLARTDTHQLVALFPKSGRQHQLRVHLAALGCPIVGDKLYGPDREAPFLEYIETGMTPELQLRLGHHRQALHAHTLTFTHPDSSERFRAVAKLPGDLVELWQGLCADGLSRLDRPSQLVDVAI
ncbi:MAG TPA: RluA family pseudouridine synthase [Polyangiales bacterium]|nr:RluA family pseudouridine synthase [Polyangiales bacterium]